MRIKAVIDLLRFPNLLITAITICITCKYATNTYPGIGNMNHGMIVGTILTTVLAIMAAGNVINDILDREIDEINRPDNIIIGRRITIGQAQLMYFILNGIGICGTMIFFRVTGNLIVSGIFVSAIFLLFIYSHSLKRVPFMGNFLVAFLCVLVLWIIPLTFDKNVLQKCQTQFFPVVLFSIFAFCTTMAREIIKDLQDKEGDQWIGARTLAGEWPLNRTKILINSFLLVNLVSLSYSLMLQVTNGEITSSVLNIGLIIFGAYLIYSIFKMEKSDHYSRLSKYLKYYMLPGLLLLALWH